MTVTEVIGSAARRFKRWALEPGHERRHLPDQLDVHLVELSRRDTRRSQVSKTSRTRSTHVLARALLCAARGEMEWSMENIQRGSEVGCRLTMP